MQLQKKENLDFYTKKYNKTQQKHQTAKPVAKLSFK